MTWNKRYIIPFVTIDDQHLTVNIWQADYSGTAKQLTPAAEPFTTSEGTSTDLYTPVRTQSGYIRFIVEDAATDIAASLLSASATAHPVTLTSADGTILWAGFLKGEQYTQPWQSYPYQQELPVCSVMSTMDGVNFTQDNGFTSIQSLTALISTYLPFDLTTIIPSVIDATLQVPNSNWHTFLTEQERKDKNTTAIYSVSSVKSVMEDFCRYFGVSLHENGTALVFYAHDAQYTGATARDLTAQQIRSASNSAGYTTAYRYVKGTFSANGDRAGGSPIELPSKFSDTFAIDKAYMSYVIYKGNSDFHPYVNGAEGTITVKNIQLTGEAVNALHGNGYNFSEAEVIEFPQGDTFGQIVSCAKTNIDASGDENMSDNNMRYWPIDKALKINGYTTSWKDSILFRFTKGCEKCTAFTMRSSYPVYIASGIDSVFNLNFSVENDMPNNKINPFLTISGIFGAGVISGSDPYIRCIYAKIKLGKYYLKSTLQKPAYGSEKYISQNRYMYYEWSETEQECCLWLRNNKLQFFNGIVDPLTGTSMDYMQLTSNNASFTSLKGINISVPADIRGSYVDFSIEIMAEVYSDLQFMFFVKDPFGTILKANKAGDKAPYKFSYNYVQFFLQDLTVKFLYPASTTDQVTGGYGSNTYLASNNNNQPDGTELSAPITTRRGSQVGAGVAMDADHNYITTFYDRLGVTRRAAIVDKPRQVLNVTMAGLFSPVDTFTWNGHIYAILAQAMKWRMNQNTVRMLDITNPGTTFNNTEGIIDSGSGSSSGGSGSGGNNFSATGGSSSGASANASHADYAEEAGHATSSATIDNDSPVWTRVKTFIANAVSTLTDTVKGMFLRKDQDDTTEHKLTMGEAEVTGKAKVGGKTSMVGGATVGDGTYGIDKDGIATLAGEVAEYLKSKDFNTDNPRFGSGLGMLMKDGVSYGYIDYLTVRTKMTAEQLEVRVLSRVAGDYAFTKAGSHIVYVEVKADRYRCYYTQDDGTTQTINNWQVGDFAKCKTSNIETGKSGYTATRYYNRLVIAASSEPVTVDGLDATKKYGYIDLAIDDSNTIEYPYTDSDGNSQTAKLVCTDSIDGEDVPQAQDDIVQWGNAFANETQYTKGTFKARGNVLLMSVSEGGLLTYTQIDQPVDGSAMAQYMTDCILPTMVRFSSDHFIIAPYAQRDAADTVICFRDDWNDKMVCGHNDVVRHSDKLWQCIVNVGETTNDYDEAYREPKLTSPIWKIYVKGIPSAGKPVLTIAESTGESMYVSDTDIVTIKVQDALAANADADITSGYGFSVSRNSGNTDADTVWNTAHASIATNTFELTADDLTLAAMTQAVTFTVTAKKGDSILTMPFVKRLTGKNDLRIEFSSNVGPFVSVSRVDLQFTGRIMFGDEDITATVLADSRNTFVWTRDSGIESEDKSWVPTILTDKDGTQHPNILCVHQYANEPTGRKDCGSQWEKRLQVKYTLTATIYTDTTYNAKTVTLAESTGIASV